jgi:G3E family GTPase
MEKRTPMHLVAGTLGSGKTTLLRHLLAQDLGRAALIVNEFGELGIDGQVLEGRSLRLIELPGGCVCCSLAGEFAAAVEELCQTVGPELILVETTGVAEADALVLDVEEQLPGVRLETVIVLVDADVCLRFPRWGYTERTQIEVADILVVNKIDLVERSDLDEIRGRVRACNGRAALVETCQGRLDPGLIRGEYGPRPRVESQAREHAFSSFSWTGAGELDRARFAEAVHGWPAAVYRAKGYVRLEGGLWLFNYVAGRWQLEEAAGGRPGLVWIGPALEGHQQAILAGMEQCGRGL